MKITKRIIPLLLCAGLLLLAACGGAPDSQTTAATGKPLVPVRIAALKGPTGVGIVQLTQNAEKYPLQFVGAPSDMAALLAGASASVDVAALPLNLAASLYNKTNGAIQILAVNTLGVLYIVENGTSIKKISDLKGKTICAVGQGATPEYILNHLLRQNGLDPQKDLTIEYKQDPSEAATLAATGRADICLLPEPNVTAALAKNADLRVALDLTREWEAQEGNGQLAQGCLAVRRAFAQEHPEELAAFLTAYRASVDFVNTELDAAAELTAAQGILPSAAVAKAAIPRCSIVCITGAEMKPIAQKNLQLLFDADKTAVGGAMPKDDFYAG